MLALSSDSEQDSCVLNTTQLDKQPVAKLRTPPGLLLPKPFDLRSWRRSNSNGSLLVLVLPPVRVLQQSWGRKKLTSVLSTPSSAPENLETLGQASPVEAKV